MTRKAPTPMRVARYGARLEARERWISGLEGQVAEVNAIEAAREPAAGLKVAAEESELSSRGPSNPTDQALDVIGKMTEQLSKEANREESRASSSVARG